MTEKTGRTTRMLQAALAASAPNKPRPYVVGAHARHAEDLRHALVCLLGADPAPWHPEVIPLSALDSGFDWRIMRRRGSNRPVFVDHYAWSAYFDRRVQAAQRGKEVENRPPLDSMDPMFFR